MSGKRARHRALGSVTSREGDAVAQNNLGVIYRDGQGVALDYSQVAIWFRKFADQRDAVAQNNLGGIYYEGQGVLQDFVTAHMWFNLAASRAEDAETREQAAKNSEIRKGPWAGAGQSPTGRGSGPRQCRPEE